jgi:type IV pilus assembly protein PilW
METVISARIYLLVRSGDTVPFYVNSKTYQLGDEVVAAANDGFLRNVFTTTVALRNSASRNLFN